MSKTNFEKLRIYELSELVADRLWDVVSGWDPFAKDTIGKQIVRAADSVGANIAEGLGRGSDGDHARFIKIARGSLNEVRHFLRRAHKRNLLDEETTLALKPLMDELSPKLNAYLNSIGRPKP